VTILSGYICSNSLQTITCPQPYRNLRKVTLAFQKKHQEFLTSETSILIQTENKIKANNHLHARLMSMLLDGQEIFENDDSIKLQFVFSLIIKLMKNGKGYSSLVPYILYRHFQ
jgi:hypothetical protein